MGADRQGVRRKTRVKKELNLQTKWYQKQLRIQQTILREPDIVDYDVESVVQYLQNHAPQAVS